MSDSIKLHGVREHNLKDLTLEIPRDKLVVVTGVSGSGKSTLAFNVLFSEGQRRFLDSMNAYARQFIEQLPKADLDYIEGIPPAVSIEQRSTRGGGKSTVATLTEIYHFLRLLYARTGIQYCTKCNVPIAEGSRESVLQQMQREIKKMKDCICMAPIIRNKKGIHVELLQKLAEKGILNVRIDGEFHYLEAIPKLERYVAHDIDAVIFSTATVNNDDKIKSLLEVALQMGDGVALLQSNRSTRGEEKMFSAHRACPKCGISYNPLDPYDFSFNNPRGWCPECHGFGETFFMPQNVNRGAREEDIEESWFNWSQTVSFLENERQVCSLCHGSRIKETSRFVYLPLEWFPSDNKELKNTFSITNDHGPSIEQLCKANTSDILKLLDILQITDKRTQDIARDILPEIRNRLLFLNKVGLDYLTLDRGITTLSGGETQRIRLAAQLGSTLGGVLYILDEPTIGLHARDNSRLLNTLQELRSRGNSVIVVEHDTDTIQAADHIIDIGPRAGINGGKIVFQGDYKKLLKCQQSLTAQCLREATRFNNQKRSVNKKTTSWICLNGATRHNLKNVSAAFPLNRFSVVTGVSGSGKSTLVRELLYPTLKQAFERDKCASGLTFLFNSDDKEEKKIPSTYIVDQSPIGRTPRSVPATYIGFFDQIRKIFAQTIDAKLKGYQVGRFSFNSNQGRCHDCEGAGLVKITMNFMPPAFVNCNTCHGFRFNPETLDVCYQGKNIAEVLDMTVEEAIPFFQNHRKICKTLQLLADTGLEYIKLGQPSPTLSGGEAQRIKLVTHLQSALNRTHQEGSIFILEEPTIGLHIADVKLLVDILQRLVDAGNTVIVIEHNLDLIACADYIIDMGPEGGPGGGKIQATGTPEEIAKTATHTGIYLRKYLETHK